MSPKHKGPKARLIDERDEGGRTTTALVASLSARLATLHMISGGAAVGSLAAGVAALGREVSRTAEGALLRRALSAGRPGTNGQTLWTELKIRDWLDVVPPSPVLDHLRNDVALLLASDLDEALSLMPMPSQGASGVDDQKSADFLDMVVGLWALSREIFTAVEAMAEPTRLAAGRVEDSPVEDFDGSEALLR